MREQRKLNELNFRKWQFFKWKKRSALVLTIDWIIDEKTPPQMMAGEISLTFNKFNGWSGPFNGWNSPVCGLMYQSRIRGITGPEAKLYYLTILSHWFSLTTGIRPQTEGQWRRAERHFQRHIGLSVKKDLQRVGELRENPWHSRQLTKLKVRAEEEEEHLLKGLKDNEEARQNSWDNSTQTVSKKSSILPEPNCKITTKPTSGSIINYTNSAQF